MNTSQQVHVIIGLLMVGTIATLLYFLWDNVRETNATERQLTENAERGGALFSLNCSSCHGITGKGGLERSVLPGAVLNDPAKRATKNDDLIKLQARFRNTIHCGRVGTRMPAWSSAEGGSLNDFQIEQLVALITGTLSGFDAPEKSGIDPNAISEAGWASALERANHAASFDPPKALAKAIGPQDTVLVLAEPTGMSKDDVLRTNDDPLQQGY